MYCVSRVVDFSDFVVTVGEVGGVSVVKLVLGWGFASTNTS